MTSYWIQAAVTTAAAFGLFALNLKKQGQVPSTAAVALPMSLLLGLALAKVGYVVLLQLDYILEFGEWDVLLDFEPKRLSFICGSTGVWLGIRLAAKVAGQNPRKVLDAFAAPGALLVAGLRAAEMHLGKLGAGALTEGTGFFYNFPFMIIDQWGDRYLSVWFLEAAAALVIALWAWKMNEGRDGFRFEKTVFALALCQVLLENLRNQAMKWGFVYTEQVLCAVILLALTLLACARRSGGGKRFLPAAGILGCMGLVVGEEFARQKGSSELLAAIGFPAMALILAGMAWIYAGTVQPERPGKA